MWACRLNPGPRVVGALVHGDGDDGEMKALEFLVHLLPHGQVVAAPSPRGVGDKENLVTPVI